MTISLNTLARACALVSVAVLAASTLPGAAVGASAPQTPKPTVLAKNLPGPLSTAVAKDGSVYVTANFAGMLMHVVPGEKPTVVYRNTEKGAEVGGVSVGKGGVVFTVTTKKAQLVRWSAGSGKPTTLADVGAYEAKKNPDKNVTYGLQDAPEECQAQWPVDKFGPPTYTGIVESHPYATDTIGNTVYVADAAANAILKIDGNGKVTTVAVLPAVPVEITTEIADANGLPDCTVGLTYEFEPVPTDVEMGPDGKLYVSSLPGGPEDGSTGPQGRVLKVSPGSGKVSVLAAGLVSAVNVAVAKNGDVYVAQLFTGQIARIKAGSKQAKPYIQTSMPAGLEWTADGLYATIDALKGTKNPKGKLVRFDAK